jgi:hypothetical protein
MDIPSSRQRRDWKLVRDGSPSESPSSFSAELLAESPSDEDAAEAE